jgi:hypothetical protein
MAERPLRKLRFLMLLQRSSETACRHQTMPNTIAARNPNDTIAASTFSRILSSMVPPTAAYAA